MYLENVKDLDEESILLDEVFAELFEIEDEATRMRKYFELENRATRLKVAVRFRSLYKIYQKQFKQFRKEHQIISEASYSIEVPEKKLTFESGCWQIDENGIYTMSEKGKEYACPHLIIPMGILKGAENGLCKEMLGFSVRGVWSEVNVPREMIASSSKIVGLATYGVQVTSENARYLVKYLNDIESINKDIITDHVSTSKLGWIGKDFMPYTDSEIVFDNDPKLVSLFRSIHEQGSRDKWYGLAKEIRATGRTEVNLYMLASLASVLVEPCGALPFIVSLWGGTGLGKTVALMLATSVWADPSEGAYMSDAKATTTAMEIRLDALNSLPLCIDDMAQIRSQDEDFSQIIYRWCAGKGRDRSNQQLGLNPLTKWANCTLTNGERSLITDLMQGGASNRVIDIELTETMFKDGNKTAKILRNNYGFCGKEFVKVISELGFPEINKRLEAWTDKLKKTAAELKSEKEDKQIIPLALIMLADEISEEYIFKDGARLDIHKCLDYLKNKDEISENRRAYEYIRDRIVTDMQKFVPDENNEYKTGCWGVWLSEYEVAIIPSVFDKMMNEGNFQTKSFLSWADRNKLISKGEGKNLKKKVSVNGKRIRCVVLIFEESTEFIEVSDDMASDIPFT